jgi:hypothetical protein
MGIDIDHKDKWFANSTNEHVNWAEKEFQLFAAYMANKGKYNGL